MRKYIIAVLFVSSLLACTEKVAPQGTPNDPPPPVTGNPPPNTPPNTPPSTDPPPVDQSIPRLWSAPTDKAKGVPINTKLRLEFSLKMNPESLKVKLNPDVDLGDRIWQDEDGFQILAFNQSQRFAPNTAYTLTISGESETGKTLETVKQFNTGNGLDLLPPALVSSDPAQKSENVSADTRAMTLAFDEPVAVDPVNLNASLTCRSKIGCNGFGKITWSEDHKTVRLEFDNGLIGPVLYIAEFRFNDLAGNSSSNYKIVFFTAPDKRPLLLEYVPGMKELVSRADTPLILLFNNAMNKDSLKNKLFISSFVNRTIKNPKIASISDGEKANSYVIRFEGGLEYGSRINWYLGYAADLEGRTLANNSSGEFSVDVLK
jgi:Bacterial Ig-like domain